MKRVFGLVACTLGLIFLLAGNAGALPYTHTLGAGNGLEPGFAPPGGYLDAHCGLENPTWKDGDIRFGHDKKRGKEFTFRHDHKRHIHFADHRYGKENDSVFHMPSEQPFRYIHEFKHDDFFGKHKFHSRKHIRFDEDCDFSDRHGMAFWKNHEYNDDHMKLDGDKWFRHCDLNGPVGTDNAPVPEPATILLIGSGLLSAIGFRRRK